MTFKIGDIVQLNPAMRDQVTANTWRKLDSKPLRIKEVLEFGMFKAYMYTDPHGGVVIGRNDSFIPWDPEKSLLNIEEII